MRSDLFMHEVTGTSNVFGRKSGVKVVFRGESAATNHETIYLPSLGADKDVSDEQQRIIRGYADHEAGHIRHTDRKASEAFFEECKAKGDMLLKHVWNALEDVWLERRVIGEYPGSLDNLKATASAVDRQAMEQMAEAGDKIKDPKVIGPVAITWEGRKTYGHGTGEQCLEMLDPALRERLGDWIAGLDGCASTRDVIELARKVTDELRSDALASRDEPESGDEGEAGETEAKAGDEKSDAGESPAKPERDGDEEGETGEPEPDKGEGEDEPSVEPESSAADGEPASAKDVPSKPTGDDADVIDFDLAAALKKELGDLIDTSHESYRAYTTEYDRWHTRRDETWAGRELKRGEASDYERLLAKMGGTINVARRTLERVLAAKMNRDWDYGREAGRLDTRRLVRAYNAQPNVFKMRSESESVDTAVTLLIDLSGSMYGFKVRTAQDTAIVFAEAMVKAGVAVEVLGFTNNSHPKFNRDVGLYSRYEPLDMIVFKAFEERLIDARGAMAAMSELAHGNNTDGEALLYAYGRLKRRPERRHVLLVLSDGEPAARTAFYGHLDKHLSDVVEMITKAGVECVGIGILDASVERFYPRHVVVRRVEDLGTTVMNEIAKVLLGDRFVLRGAA